MAGIDNNTLLYLRGDSFTDLSLKNNSITNSSVTIVDDDYINKCFDFNSSNKHLALNDVNLFNLGSSNFTIEFYMKLPTGNLNGYHLFGKRTAASSNISSTCFFNDTNLNFILSIDGSTGIDVIQIPHSTFIRNEWYHIAYIRDGNYVKMFINGKLSGMKSFTGSIYNSSEKFKIGAVNSIAGGFFKGWLAHFRISNIARYTEDFTPPTQPYNSINIYINNQTEDKIDFNISKLGQETINKIEVLVNDELSKTYDSMGDLTYDIDKSLCNYGINNLKIKVTFDNNYTEEKEITYFLPNDELPKDLLTNNATLKEVFDRQQQLLFNIGQQKDMLKSILLSKNVEITEDEDKMSILIQKVNELGEFIPPLYLYNEGVFNPLYEKVEMTEASPINYQLTYFELKYKGANGNDTLCRLSIKNIDFTNYTNLKIECDANVSTSTNANFTINIAPKELLEPSAANAILSDVGRTNFSKEIRSIDVTNVNGMYHLNLTIYLSSLKIYKIWLEK